LSEDVLVLPSHGEPFRGLHRRLDALAAHHAERLDVLAEACREPLTAFEAAGVLFPRATQEMAQIGFTVGETLAHLRRWNGRGGWPFVPGPGEAVRFQTR
jgi:glyoxylase-like metal-dependent hydrolase (beta-lactamase superfamily II)